MSTMTTPVVLEENSGLLIPISHQYDIILSEIIRRKAKTILVHLGICA